MRFLLYFCTKIIIKCHSDDRREEESRKHLVGVTGSFASLWMTQEGVL